MATRTMALCLALSGLAGTASGQTSPAPENWTPIGRAAQTVTGRVTFAPSEITFQNGKSLPLARGGQMLFRPEPKKRKVTADLYRVTPPDQPVLENGNTLCKGKAVVYLLVWQSEKTGKEADPRTLAPFSGRRGLICTSPGSCAPDILNKARPLGVEVLSGGPVSDGLEPVTPFSLTVATSA